jgi:4-hydroxy-2-oxoheptanedioate aldolase
MRERVNLIKQRLNKGEVAIGLAVQMHSPETIELAGAAGFDYVYIDCEHGSFYLDGLANLIRAAEATGVTPIVRVPNHEPSFIMRVLDAGALGIIAPNVTSAEEARAIVSAARYKDGNQSGTRGACPGTRATWHQTIDWPAFVKWSNENIYVWALIESEAGIDNVEEIASVPGVDALMLGQFDLSHAMGFQGQPHHPVVEERYGKVMRAASEHRLEVVASLFSHDPSAMGDEKRRWMQSGARILVAGSDRRIFYNGMTQRVKALRGG